jgi:hypothetical protein
MRVDKRKVVNAEPSNPSFTNVDRHTSVGPFLFHEHSGIDPPYTSPISGEDSPVNSLKRDAPGASYAPPVCRCLLVGAGTTI